MTSHTFGLETLDRVRNRRRVPLPSVVAATVGAKSCVLIYDPAALLRISQAFTINVILLRAMVPPAQRSHLFFTSGKENNIMANEAPVTQAHVAAEQAVLNLLCLALALAFLSAVLAAMLTTCNGPPTLDQSIVILTLGSFLCIGSLASFVALRQTLDDQDESPIYVMGQLAHRSAQLVPIPLAIYIGGRFAPVVQAEPLYGWLAAALTGIALLWLFQGAPPLPFESVLRGTVLISHAKAERRCAKLTAPGQLTLPCGPLRLLESHFKYHCAICGATGSGKTTILQRLLREVVLHITAGSDWRCLIYDAKQDIIGMLSQLPLTCEVIILNPLDTRSVAWDIAADVTSPAVALEIATILVEDEKGQNSFFVKAARDLFAAAMTALHLTRGSDWTFADLLIILSSTERTRALLNSTLHTRAQAREHFERDDQRTLSNVQYTITANVSCFRPLAALGLHATRLYSLREWVNGNSILVLGNAEDCRAPIDALNRALFHRLTELVLAQSESTTRRSWFFLDELPDLGHLASLKRLLGKGRSKGVRAALVFLTIEGLRQAFGEKEAHDIVGLCANKIFMRTDSPETAQHCSSIIGEAETCRWLQSIQHGKDGDCPSTSQQIAKTEAVLPSQLLRLPLAGPKGSHAYCVTPDIGVYHGVTRFVPPPPARVGEPNFIARPESEQYLPAHLLEGEDIDMAPWSLDDIDRMHVRREPRMWEDDLEQV
jgi:hypothetical protein